MVLVETEKIRETEADRDEDQPLSRELCPGKVGRGQEADQGSSCCLQGLWPVVRSFREGRLGDMKVLRMEISADLE